MSFAQIFALFQIKRDPYFLATVSHKTWDAFLLQLKTQWPGDLEACDVFTDQISHVLVQVLKPLGLRCDVDNRYNPFGIPCEDFFDDINHKFTFELAREEDEKRLEAEHILFLLFKAYMIEKGMASAFKKIFGEDKR